MTKRVCPNCAEEIGEQDQVCPSCGTAVPVENDVLENPVEEKEITSEQPEEQTPELEKEDQEKTEEEAAPSSPLPTDESGGESGEQAPPVPKSNKKRNILIAVLVVVVLIAAVVGYKIYKEKQYEERLEAYQFSLNMVAYDIYDSAVKAEDICVLVGKVWYNSIRKISDSETDPFTRPYGYFFDDFNDALDCLMSDADFMEKQYSLQGDQLVIETCMQLLQNPPQEYTEAYRDAKNLYNAYLQLRELALNPEGSYNSFTDTYSKVDVEVMNCYNIVKLYL